MCVYTQPQGFVLNDMTLGNTTAADAGTCRYCLICETQTEYISVEIKTFIIIHKLPYLIKDKNEHKDMFHMLSYLRFRKALRF